MSKFVGLTTDRFELALLAALTALGLGAGVVMGNLGIDALLLTVSVLAFVLLLALRQYAIIAAVIVVITVIIDWYELFGAPLRLPIIGMVVTLIVLVVLFFAQSRGHPWVALPGWWLWALLLAVTLPQVFHGANFIESALYYVQIFVNALLMYLLGVQVARAIAPVRRLLSLLSAFGTLVGLHSAIITATGTFLLANSRANLYLASHGAFDLLGSQTARAGSFLQNPDWDGAFLALLLFIPLGLLLESRSFLVKLLYFGEFLLIFAGLFATYSLASLFAVSVGAVLALALVVRGRMLLYIFGALGAVVAAVFLLFSEQLTLLIDHLNSVGEFSLRLGAWETALQIIRQQPLGIGLGLTTYLQVEVAYRVPLQYRLLAHPHDAYLEIGALAGVPVLLLFLALVGMALWLAARIYRRAGKRERALLGFAAIAIAVFCVNNIAINAWTLPPLAAIAWLILGAISSPALLQSFSPQLPSAAQDAPVSQPEEVQALAAGGVR